MIWISKLRLPFHCNCNKHNCLLIIVAIKQNCFWKIQSLFQHLSDGHPMLSQMGAGQATYRFSGEPAKSPES